MKRKIFATDNSYNWFILRIVLGVVVLAHGLQKTFGWFGGFGWEQSMNYFTGHVGLPSALAALVILIESLGAFLLIIGFAGRINAFLLGIVMIGAFFVDHRHNGFFMNWFGNQRGEGFEFDLLIWAITAVLTVNGSGRLSIDRLLARGYDNQSVKYTTA
ncbi:DoxX family protein [Pseudobacter ginsenosidimutans]|uniref:Putative oxidoreductase n=1 Tax=Pseudobacter ginsenosidimutans TaxID=661488 RepID=A0A4Q7MA69_9BACT|nr:DoxX family protein [Pseudobacter ginsenosidimutans]QEC42767.1 DoxX family protein [Pseudobacter ginsenosidimutans]RZS65075.1 putative oxidoreductase [Pseudobacter ginsenosidimutans]